MGVYLPIKDYSAMQGPSPSGFHVPLNTEWQAVYDVWTALGGGSSDGTNFGIALKLPFAGYRYNSNSNASYQGVYGYYWSSTRRNTNNAYSLYFSSTDLNPQDDYLRALGFSVRCFKNSPVVPMSSWTKLYGTSIESGGIFWNSSKGLISLSSNGQTRITIADKNLGATTVWNSGDTLSEANCGKYYQWGNNYGFPRTGTIANQSTTQVDASNYGPGNYYSSDTFIKYNGRWDTTDNGNLRGGVTGVKPMSELKNAYIGEVGIPSYTPTTNTVAYYPLKYDFKDYSGNGNDMVGYNSPQIVKANGVRCLDLSTNSSAGTNNKYLSAAVGTLPQGNSARTEICWVYYNGLGYGATWHYGRLANYQSDMMGWNLSPISWGSYGYNVDSNVNAQTGIWYMLAVTASSSSQRLYINGQSSWSASYPINTNGTTLYLGVTMDTGHPGQPLYLSEVIFENRVRTATEISDYYNSNKGLYGL